MALIDEKTLDVPVGLSLNSKAGIFPFAGDPSILGLDLPIGSLALDWVSGKTWRKAGVATTAWAELASSTGGGFDPGFTVIVAKSGGDTASIETGLALAAALSPSPTNPVAVIVYPGEYTENPLTVGNYTNVIAAGGLGSVIIKPTSPTAAIVTSGNNSELYGLVISGASGAGGVGIYTAAANGLIRSCLIRDCETGIRVTGASASPILQDLVLFRAPGTTLTTGIRVDTNARATFQSVTVSGTPISTVATALLIDAAANVTVSSFVAEYAVQGAYIDATPLVVFSAFSAGNCTVAIKLDGATTNLQANACGIRDCVSDITILNPGVAGYYTGSAQIEKIDLDGATKFFVQIIQFTAGDEAVKIIAELHVGTPDRPGETCLGEGDSNVIGMYVFGNSNGEAGAWTDNTAAAKSVSGSTFSLFPGVTAGNCFYIGNSDRMFPGFKLEDITPAMDIGTGAVIAEYWNGAAWVQLYVMETDADPPYTQRANAIFESLGNTQIRFGLLDSWTAKTLNGVNAYWVRVRITSAITTSPVAERAKCHTNRTEINGDGFREYFGDAQPEQPIELSLMTDILGFNSSNVNLNANANTYLVVENNDRDRAKKDGSGGQFRVPDGLNTALPITFRILFAPSTADVGNVENEMYLAPIGAGRVLDGTIPERGPVGAITAVGGTADKIYACEHSFIIDDVLPGNTFIWSLIRDATGGNPDDTLNASIYIVGWTLTGYFWR
jgi:hypothetical protein